MKTKPFAAAAEEEAEPKKIRSSRSKHRRGRRSRSSSSSASESPPRKRSKKHSKRVPDKKSKRSEVRNSTHRRRHRSRSLSSISSPSPVARRSFSTCSSSASERSVSPPPRSRSRDVRKKKDSGRGRERDRKRRKVRRTTSYSSSSASSGSSRSRSRSRKQRTVDCAKDGAASDKIEQDYNIHHATRSEENLVEDHDRDENHTTKKGHNEYEKNVGLEKMESPCPMNDNETEDTLPGGGNSDAEDLELILRQKALENFRKFREAAAVAGKTDNGATGKEALRDSAQGAGTKTAEAMSAALSNFQRQGSSLGVRHSAGSPLSEDCGNGTSHSWKQASNAGISRGAGSPGMLETGDTGGPTQEEGKAAEATPSTSQFRSPQDGRNSPSVMQRLVSTPGSCASVKQTLGSNAGASHVNGAPRIRSVVSIPSRQGPDGSTYTPPPRPSENSATIVSSTKVGRSVIDSNKAEGANGADRKTSEASASNGSTLSPGEGKSQARTEDKDGSEFQKKTFSRMHDGEAVEVSYKVYIPKKTPALARRKLQR